jgi:HAMP domain-containing protein
MKDKALLAVVAIIFLAAGFVAGLAVGRRQGPRLSPTDRLTQKFLDGAGLDKPLDAKRIEEVDALKKAFLKKLDKDLRNTGDDDHGHGK